MLSQGVLSFESSTVSCFRADDSAGHVQEEREALHKHEMSRDTHRALVSKRRADPIAGSNRCEQKRLDAAVAAKARVSLDKANADAAAMQETNKSLEKQIRSRELGR